MAPHLEEHQVHEYLGIAKQLELVQYRVLVGCYFGEKSFDYKGIVQSTLPRKPLWQHKITEVSETSFALGTSPDNPLAAT